MSNDERKRKLAAEASRRWRERNPERAKQVERDAYHRRQAKLGKPKKVVKYETDAERKEARKASRRKWVEKNKDKVREIRKRSYENNAERQRAKSLEWYYANKDRVLARLRETHLRERYGLSLDAYAALGTVCEICGAQEDSRKGFKLAVDHDHDTGKVRGLLCGNCNCGIGYFKHDADLLAKAIAYLGR